MTAPAQYIVVEGPIGVGKTTLTRLLAESLGYDTLLEPAFDNPFLDRFYREGRAHALPTQLYFLLHRAQQMRDLRRDDLFGTRRVADFLIEKDRLFAELTLDAVELELYESVYAHLTVEAPTPDLVIYLQAPPRVLQQRIRGRGIDAEQRIQADYLERLATAYTHFFHDYSSAPLLIVNASDVDFAGDPRSYEELLARIRNPSGTRTYFNPQPSLLP